MNIIKGPKKVPVRAVIYAIAGFGKTSTAAGIPGALFIDVEGSSERYDVARIEAKKHVEIVTALKECARDAKALVAQGFATIVIDTADWVQAAIEDAMCRAQNKPSIAECSGGFGKGYVEAGRKFAEILELCDSLVFAGFHVVFLAHSAVKKVSPPGEMQSYDRFVLAMDEKNFATPLYEWAEMVLFGRFEADVVEIKDGKRIKATDSAQRRVLHTSDATAWFAKNRFSLPREIPVPTVEIGADGKIPAAILPPELAAVFAGKLQRTEPAPVAKATPAPVPEAPAPEAPAPEAPAPEAPALEAKRATPEQVGKIESYMKNSIGLKVVSAAFDHYKAVDATELYEEEAAWIIGECQTQMNAAASAPKAPAKPLAAATGAGIATAFPWPPSFVAWLTTNEVKANAFCVMKNWIPAGKTWRDLTAERAEKVVEHDGFFATSAGIPPREGGAK